MNDYFNEPIYNESSYPSLYDTGHEYQGTSQGLTPEQLVERDREREKEQMSFTGVVVCTDGIVAFGDSRSTLRDEFGTPRKLNDTTRKVFRINDFIMTASGRNTIYVNGQDTTMEAFITENAERFRTPYDFIDMFSRTVSPANGTYYFSFGIRNNNETGIIAFDIMDGRITYMPKRTNIGAAFYDTIPVYTKSFESNVHLTDMTTEEASTVIEDWMKHEIQYVDKHYDYNYVGLPLQIEILKKN